MIEGHVFIATSLDGFVARRDRTLDWLMKQDVDPGENGYDSFIADKDGLIMGSGSFRTLLSFDAWPYEKPVIVLSRSMGEDDIPSALRGKVRLSREAPAALMQRLEAEGWSKAYVDGGQIIQSFMREGLISEMTITLAPILLGDGIRLFGPLDADIDLELMGTTRIAGNMVSLHYRVR